MRSSCIPSQWIPCLDSACHGIDIIMGICGVNDSITDRIEMQLAAGVNSEDTARTRARMARQ